MSEFRETLLPMGQIQVLPEGLANRIAAGEVVERPASVTKELIENSLDAQATEITISIKNAGFEEILISDNGWGMDNEDVLLAFRRHATSKIKSAEDLLHITHMGFRGEALPSIASVARVEVVSRREDRDEGIRYHVDGGKARGPEPSARERGTTIKVRSLFFNVPARRKFLKTPATEYSHIVTAFKRYALAYPELRWTLIKDGNTIWDFTPSDLKGRIVQIFGESTAPHLHEVDGRSGDMLIHGIIGGEALFRKSKGDQFLFINRRPFQNSSLNHAVINGFGPLIQYRQVPFYVLFLQTDPEEFDVNVHPAKHEVRFRDEGLAYRTVLVAIRNALGVTLKSGDSPVKADFHKKYPSPADNKAAFHNQRQNVSDGTQELQLLYGSYNPQGSSRSNIYPPDNEYSSPGQNITGNSSYQDRQENVVPISGIQHQTKEASPLACGYDSHCDDEYDSILKKENNLVHESGSVISGKSIALHRTNVWQVHGTYIFSQVKSGLVIIDQHVAHERILFEKAMAALRDRPWFGQELLFPVEIILDSAESALLEEIVKPLARMGLTVEKIEEGKWLIRSVPAALKIKSEEKLVKEIIRDYQKQHEVRLDPQEILAASFACKAAIKAGDILNLEEMNSLIDDLFQTEYPFVCPHGRPVVVNLTLHDLHKLFGRE